MESFRKAAHQNHGEAPENCCAALRKDSTYLTVSYDGQLKIEEKVQLLNLGRSQRLLKAARSLGIFWACAGIAAFIPILHFVLVPALLIAGLFFAANSYSDDIQLGDFNFICFNCNQSVELRDRTDQFPKWISCPNCGNEYRIEKTVPPLKS